MAYSNKKIPNDPTLFPEPQTWVTWVAGYDYERKSDNRMRLKVREDGSVRHHYTLADARKTLMWIGSRSKYKERGYYEGVESGKFSTDWAVYRWTGQEWELVFQGAKGEDRNSNPLFKRNWKNFADNRTFAQIVDETLEERAIKSILNSVKSA